MTAPIVIPPFASSTAIDEIVAGIVAELAAEDMHCAPQAIRQLRELIEAYSTSHVIDGVRYALAPDGVIREVAEH